MSPRAQRLHETADRQIAELAERLSSADEAGLRRDGAQVVPGGTAAPRPPGTARRTALSSPPGVEDACPLPVRAGPSARGLQT